MAVSLHSVFPFNPMQVTRSYVSSSFTRNVHVPLPLTLTKSKKTINSNRRTSHLLAAETDRVVAELNDNSSVESSENPTAFDDPKIPEKKVPLTARERLRAARVLSRYSDAKPVKTGVGRSVLDALRESEKGKKGLPQAPTNMLDDQKRGMPKAGLTFDFPGGRDLFFIIFSFVFISTVMFATTYFVWKVGAIHFNEN